MSRYSSRFLEILAAGAALAAAALAFAPTAEAQPAANGVEAVAGASYYSGPDGSEIDLSSWGLRLHHDFNERWGLEFAYINQDQGSLDAEIYEVDARIVFFENERVRVFAVVGGGALSYDYVYHVGGDAYDFGQDDTLTLNSGVAAEIALGDRFYFRPDFRERWAFDLFGPYEDSTSEATLAFGYRF